MAPNELAEKLEASADATDNRFDAAEMRAAASLIRALNERVERLEGALGDLLLRLENKIALARDSNATSYGHSYVLCAGIEACIEASKSRAALERK